MKSLLRRQFIQWIVVSIVFGAFSGVLGAAWTIVSLTNYTEQLSQSTRTTSLANLSKPSVSSYPNAVKFLSDISQESVVSVYPKISHAPYGYQKDTQLTTGVVVTADGWVAAPLFANNSADTLRVQVKDHVFDVSRLVVDPLTKTMFLKCDTENLSVVKFGSALDASPGDHFFVSTSATEFAEAFFSDVQGQQGVLLSSDAASKQVLVSSSIRFSSNPVFDSAGSFIGFVFQKNDKATLVPVEYILPSLNTILEKKEIVRPVIGVSYVDLAYAIGFPDMLRRGRKYGAYVTGHPAVKKGSPAANAGLMDGDIILSVDGEDLDRAYGLADAIMTRRVGDKILCVIDRAGEKKTVEIILGSL